MTVAGNCREPDPWQPSGLIHWDGWIGDAEHVECETARAELAAGITLTTSATWLDAPTTIARLCPPCGQLMIVDALLAYQLGTAAMSRMVPWALRRWCCATDFRDLLTLHGCDVGPHIPDADAAIIEERRNLPDRDTRECTSPDVHGFLAFSADYARTFGNRSPAATPDPDTLRDLYRGGMITWDVLMEGVNAAQFDPQCQSEDHAKLIPEYLETPVGLCQALLRLP